MRTAKETTDKTKRQPAEWEKICVNDATDRGLISKVYRQLIHLNIRENNPTSRRPKQTFLQRKHTDDQQAHERHSASLNVREMRIKTTMRYHFTTEQPSLKSLQIINAGEGVERKEPSYTAGRNVNWCSH